jgi:hypothetical protein
VGKGASAYAQVCREERELGVLLLSQLNVAQTFFAWSQDWCYCDRIRSNDNVAIVEYALENTAKRAVTRLQGRFVDGRQLHLARNWR